MPQLRLRSWVFRPNGDTSMNLLILVVDDEPDVEMLFRQHFRRDLRESRFTMEFAQSGHTALQRITDPTGVSLILVLSDINMPGMTGLDLLPKAKAARPDATEGEVLLGVMQERAVDGDASGRRSCQHACAVRRG